MRLTHEIGTDFGFIRLQKGDNGNNTLTVKTLKGEQVVVLSQFQTSMLGMACLDMAEEEEI